MIRRIVLTLAAIALAVSSCTAAEDVVFLGDSNVWLGGDSCNNSRGWTHRFVELLHPRSAHSYARSGATWTNHPDTKPNTDEYTELLANDNVIYNQVLRLIEACDEGCQASPTLIIVAAGGNDAWFVEKRPGIFDNQAVGHNNLPCSLSGSVKLVCSMLTGRFPDATLVLMTSHQMTKPNPATLTKVCDIVAEVGNDLGLIIIRTDKDGPTKRDEELKGFVNTYDGVHTSAIGAQRTAEFVMQQLQNNLK